MKEYEKIFLNQVCSHLRTTSTAGEFFTITYISYAYLKEIGSYLFSLKRVNKGRLEDAKNKLKRIKKMKLEISFKHKMCYK